MGNYSIMDFIEIISFLFSIIIFIYSIKQVKKAEKFTGYTQLLDISNTLFTQSLEYPEFDNPSFTLDYDKILSADPNIIRKYLAFINLRLGFCEQILYFKNQLHYIDEPTFIGVFQPLIDAMARFHTLMISELLEFYHEDLQMYLQEKYDITIIRDETKKKILNKAQPLPGEET